MWLYKSLTCSLTLRLASLSVLSSASFPAVTPRCCFDSSWASYSREMGIHFCRYPLNTKRIQKVGFSCNLLSFRSPYRDPSPLVCVQHVLVDGAHPWAGLLCCAACGEKNDQGIHEGFTSHTAAVKVGTCVCVCCLVG
jgi:hypothetical protein